MVERLVGADGNYCTPLTRETRTVFSKKRADLGLFVGENSR